MVRRITLSTVLVFWAATGLGDFSEQLEQAEQLRQQKRFGEAETVYRQIIASAGVSDDGLKAYEKLILMQIPDRLSQAQQAYKDMMTSFSGYEGLVDVFQSELGCAFREADDYRTALEIYHYLLAHTTGGSQELSYRSSLFKCYVGLGDDPNADGQLQQVLTRFAEDEGLADTIWDMAYECRSMKKWGRSRTLFEHFMERWGGHEKALLAQRGIAKASIKLGDVERADAAIARLIELFGTSKGVIHQVKELGDDWAESQKYAKAVGLYKYVVATWPADANAMLAQMKLVFAYIGLGDIDNAEAATETLVTQFADEEGIAEAVHEVVECYRNAGHNERARKLYAYLLEQWPHSPPALMELQVGLALSGIKLDDEPNTASAVADLIADFNDSNTANIAKGLFQIAEEHFYKREYGKTIELLELIDSDYADRDFPSKNELPYILGHCYGKVGEYDRAVKNYRRSLEEHPECRFNRSAGYWAGRICITKLQDYEQAIYLFAKQRELYPDDPFAEIVLYCMGQCYHEKIKDYARAGPCFEEYIAEYPGAVNMWAAYRGLVDCYAKSGDKEAALAVAREAHEKGKRNAHLDKVFGRLIKDLEEGGGE